MENEKKALTAVVIDAEYVDALAFDFIVNFERMLGRRIQQADLCDWLTCLALDGRLRPGEHEINVSWLHEAGTSKLQNMAIPEGDYAFQHVAYHNSLGNFVLNAYPVEEELTTKADFFVESVNALGAMEDVEKILLVPDFDSYGKQILSAIPTGKDVTLFVMEPFKDRRCYVENLGYSLAHALGIKGEELS